MPTRATLAAAIVLPAFFALADQARAASTPAVQPASNADAQAAETLALIRRSYRNTTLAERTAIEFRRGASPTLRSSEVALFADTAHQPPRLRLELGRLIVSVEGRRLVAVNRYNATLYYEATLSTGVTSASLADHLPPIPLPQLAWALGPAGADDAAAALREIDDCLPIDRPHAEPGPAEPSPGTLAVDLAGVGGSQFGATASRSTGRLTEFWFGFKTGDAPTAERILARATVTPIDPGDPARWAVDPSGRTRVASIADLKALARPLEDNAKLPNLALMSRALEPADLAPDFAAAAAAESARRRTSPLPVLGIVLIYDAAKADRDDVRAGLTALLECRHLHFDPTGTRWSPGPRVERIVPVFDPGAFTAAAVAREDHAWSDPADEAAPVYPPRAFSAAGAAGLAQVTNGPHAALVVFDHDLTMRAVIDLDARRGDPAPVVRELTDALRTAWAPAPTPETP